MGVKLCKVTGKRCYPSKRQARRRSKGVGNRVRVYPCSNCGDYHVAALEKR